MTSFTLLEKTYIPSLDIELERYKHNELGTEHYHFNPKNPHTKENVFMVALKTIPQDDTGVAHILEHTVLCGSKKYPIKDPFFSMIKESVQTFMNAFTGTDFTAYPFASQNKKDFNNLMDVYLDAVFFANINKEDFLQEGWRLDFADDKKDRLVYKGIVYNEMKGAMSSPSRENYHKMNKHFSTGSTYQYNAGGEPGHIPDLKYEELKKFYEIFYHPQNATFITYGDIPAIDHQAKFEEQVLKHFKPTELKTSELAIQSDINKDKMPKFIKSEHHQDHIDEKEGSNEVVIGWHLGDSTDIKNKIIANVLISAIFGDSSKQLFGALEQFSQNRSGVISELCGFDTEKRESSFMVGLGNVKDADVDDAFKTIETSINDIVQNGIPQDKIDSALIHYEMGHKEITGTNYPYGLQLMFGALPFVVNKLSPTKYFQIEEIYKEVKDTLGNKDAVKEILKKMFNNSEKMKFLSRANPTLAEKREQEEADFLAYMFKNLSEQDKADIVQTNKELDANQSNHPDLSILPEIHLNEIEVKLPEASIKKSQEKYGTFTASKKGTNGISYISVLNEVPELSQEELDVLPIYEEMVNDLGVGNRTYQETHHWQHEKTSGVRMGLSVYNNYTTGQQKIVANFSCKALNQYANNMASVINETIQDINFSDISRIKYNIESSYTSLATGIGRHAPSFSKIAATAHTSVSGAFNEAINGYSAFLTLKDMYSNLDNPGYLENISKQLTSLHKKIIAQPKRVLAISSEDNIISDIKSVTDTMWNDKEIRNDPLLTFQTDNAKRVAFGVDTQVNYNVMGFMAPQQNHPDAPTMYVLANLLRNTYLHTAIREKGGAYGAGCSYQSQAFVFSSYRDPKGTDTYNEFNNAINYIVNDFSVMSPQEQQEKLKEAILNAIQQLDKPGSPATEARQEASFDYCEFPKEKREELRHKILQHRRMILLGLQKTI